MRRLLTLVSSATCLFFSALACGSPDSDAPEAVYPIQPSKSLVELGQPLYRSNCAGCHGDADTPPPLPFVPRHSDEGHTWHHPDRNLVDWILDGTGQQSAMPAYRGKLTEVEVRTIVAYIKTFWSEDILARQVDASQAYEEWLAQ